MPRHLAMLRSICETLGGKPGHCICGKRIDDKEHFSTGEYDHLSRSMKLTTWRGLQVNKESLVEGD